MFKSKISSKDTDYDDKANAKSAIAMIKTIKKVKEAAIDYF